MPTAAVVDDQALRERAETCLR
ncbi:MAG: hypothetical protein QOG49_1802, partial [Frankiaceae bacterium]|nr:hypothetical protein [Frankiaceae bacterium]